MMQPARMTTMTSMNVLILGSLLALIASFTAAISPNANQRLPTATGACQTEACKDLAQIYLENMDLKADPCENFYQFACGSAKRLRGLPRTRRLAVHPYIDADDSTGRDLADLVQNSAKYSTDSEGMLILRIFYKSCTNSAKILSLKGEPLLELLKRLGGLPVMADQSGWLEGQHFDWIELLTKMRHLGVDFNYLFDFKVAPSLRNNRKYIIYLDQPDLWPNEVDELRSSSMRKEAFSKTLQKLGHQDLYSRKTGTQLAGAANLATKLLRLWKPAKVRAEPIDRAKLMTVQQFELLAPNTDWSRLFSGLLRHKVDETAQIAVSELEYFIELDKQLSLANETDLANLINLRMASHVDQLLPSAYTLYHGDKTRPEQCLDLMKDLVPLVLATEYAKNFVTNEAQARVQEMIKLMKGQMIELIGEASWPDAARSALAEAQQKCDSIYEFVSHTEALKNGSLVARLYDGASGELDEAEFFMNSIRLQRRELDWFLGKYAANNGGGGDKPDDWLPHSMTITTNAFYQAQRNSINILAAIMRGSFFNESVPSYINFGALGSLVGHEISHAFDSKGAKFDKFGNLNESWWNDEAREQHQKRSQCFIDQYDKKRISDTYSYVNGTKTLAENMADTGGYSVSYRAYLKWKSLAGFVDGDEPLMFLINGQNDTGMQFDWRKLFWLAAASNNCDNMTPSQTADLASYDEHSPAEFRVNLAMSNEPKFSEAFECPLGSAMNPVRRCSLW